MPLRALLFDFGGTLDADGIAWPRRFFPLYRQAGVPAGWEDFLDAFYRSDETLGVRHPLAGLGLEATLSLQVRGVLERLAPGRLGDAPAIARLFAEQSRAAFARNRPMLERLGAGFRLGIVSNFYGNLESLLSSEGLAGLFAAVADSGALGGAKPEPAIFLHVLRRLGVEPEEAMMVGDSVERDMRGAEGLSMPHAFLAGDRPDGACCPGGLRLASLTELEAALAGGVSA